ncbi:MULTISPECIES: hypothetical protein [unclassified Neochlamydia]|uniref:hypothetical protein n=1 Tax=unclassified Neochlamydia TaxID=2643326 RepID=UPI00140AFE42|nr:MULTISPECIES: hypothetical protein [unclassified Neochlamydia]MBS4165444.1 Uncharacterized protein [Neochlamydia sp. AcF65]MBS4169413.1 Uncharacterized protein [Neochlamydia sp. AcF95]
MEPDLSFNARNHLTNHLLNFTAVASNLSEESQASDSLPAQVMEAKVIMIGEIHGQATEQIGKLVNAVASQYLSENNGKIKLLVEGDINIRAEYIASLPSAYREHIYISSWDTDASKAVIESFYNKVVSRLHIKLCHAFIAYLSDSSTSNRREIGNILKNLTSAQIPEWIEDNNHPSLRSSVESNLDDLKIHLQELQSHINQKEASLSFLTSLKIYLDTFYSMIREITIQPILERNRGMVENIQQSLSSADKIIVIAGKAHLFGSDAFSETEKVFIKEGIQMVRESLSQPETPYIILDAPSLNTFTETEEHIQTQPVPPEWLNDSVPSDADKGESQASNKTEDLSLTEIISHASSSSVAAAESEESQKEEIQASKASAESGQDAIYQALNINIEQIQAVGNREYLALQFKGSFDAIWGEIERKKYIAMEDDIMLAKLLTVTINRLLELK